MTRSRLLGCAVIAGSLATTAACASLLGIDEVGYGDPPPPADGAVSSEAGTDGATLSDGGDACSDGSCCVCPADASCVGKCVTRIYTSETAPADLTIGSTFLYWHPEPNTIYRCQTPECSSAAQVASVPRLINQDLEGLATNGSAVIYSLTSSTGVVTRYQLVTCSHGVNCDKGSLVGTGSGRVFGLSADDANIAWIAVDTLLNGTDVSVTLNACATSGCDGGATISVPIPDGGERSSLSAEPIAIARPFAFWADQNGIRAARLDGTGAVRTIVSATRPTGTLVRGGHVYFLESSEAGNIGALRRCRADGNPCVSPEIVADGISLPARTTGDDRAIYWLETHPLGLEVHRWRLDRPLRATERIAIAEGAPASLASDDARLYWSAEVDGGGGIYRLAK